MNFDRSIFRENRSDRGGRNTIAPPHPLADYTADAQTRSRGLALRLGAHTVRSVALAPALHKSENILGTLPGGRRPQSVLARVLANEGNLEINVSDIQKFSC